MVIKYFMCFGFVLVVIRYIWFLLWSLFTFVFVLVVIIYLCFCTCGHYLPLFLHLWSLYTFVFVLVVIIYLCFCTCGHYLPLFLYLWWLFSSSFQFIFRDLSIDGALLWTPVGSTWSVFPTWSPVCTNHNHVTMSTNCGIVPLHELYWVYWGSGLYLNVNT